MTAMSRCTAFAGERLLGTGAFAEVARAVRKARSEGGDAGVLIFDDATGRQIDLDPRDPLQDCTASIPGSEEPSAGKGPPTAGRPRLGVVAREVTLLPRHWDWLAQQPGGASGSLRRLVESARKSEGQGPSVQDSRQAADRFMMAMLGDQPGYEDASRALYAGDRDRFLALSASWPRDLRDYARRLAEPSFAPERADGESQPVRDLLVEQFQIAWALTAYHLDTLTTEECLWRPAPTSLHIARDGGGGWRADWPEREDYDIGPPSIGWTTWHICFWWTKALDHLHGGATLGHGDVEWPGSADEVRERITGLRDRWLAELGGRNDEEMRRLNPASWPIPQSSFATIAGWLNLELMKNAAEIGLIRFLHAARANGAPET